MSLEKIQMDKENVEIRKSFPDFKSGDTINVLVKIREGNKERIQQFQGTVIQRRNIIFDIEKTSQRSGIKNPFDDLDFHDGSLSRTGGSTELQRLKAETLSKFYSNPDIPKEVRKLRLFAQACANEQDNDFKALLYKKMMIMQINIILWTM